MAILLAVSTRGASPATPGSESPSPQTPSGQAPAGASPAPTATQTPANTPANTEGGFWTQDTLTGDWGGARKTLQDNGFALTPVYTGEVFGNSSGGRAQGLIYDGLLNVALDLDLDKMSGGDVPDTTLHANMLYLHGAGLSAGFVGDFSDTSNIAGFNSVRLQELWLQKWLWQKRFSVKLGNIAVDSEFFQSASASLFINGTFGAFNLIELNVPNAPVYPLASPGIRFQFLPTPSVYIMVGVFGMDVNSDPSTNNQNGIRFALNSSSGILLMSETGYLLNQGPNDHGLQGAYRLGSFLHTDNDPIFASEAAAANGTGELRGGGTSYAIYGVVDQQISSEGDHAISFFVRSGGAPASTNFIDWYAEGGFNFNGWLPWRKDDVAGVGIARSHVSGDFNNSLLAQGEAEPFTAETVIEATYKAQITPWWSIQPDFQYIVTPGGEERVTGNATVFGLRTTVAF